MIGIVTVNWHGYEVTCRLVENLLRSDLKPFHMVVVNNSPEEAVRFDANELFKETGIEVSHSPINAGYSGGLNIGIKSLLSKAEITHFLLLNNDVAVEDHFLREMLLNCKAENKIYAPLILYQDSGLVQNTGGKIHLWLGGTININKNVPVSKIKDQQPDFLSGCVLFMQRCVVEKVGLFDELFGSYYEDVDYCLRAQKLGIGIEILSQVQARHFHSYATKGNNAFKIYLLNRNQIMLAKKHFPLFKKMLFITGAVTRGFLQSIFHRHFLAFYRGTIEGLFS